MDICAQEILRDLLNSSRQELNINFCKIIERDNVERSGIYYNLGLYNGFQVGFTHVLIRSFQILAPCAERNRIARVRNYLKLYAQ